MKPAWPENPGWPTLENPRMSDTLIEKNLGRYKLVVTVEPDECPDLSHLGEYVTSTFLPFIPDGTFLVHVPSSTGTAGD